MGNIHIPDQNIRSDVAAVQATRNNNANTPTYFSMANYDLVWFIVFTGARTGAASLTCQMRERIGAAGTEGNLKAAATVITADSITVSLFARGEDFTATYTHVGIRMLETASQNFVVGAIALRLRARHKQTTLIA